MTVADERVATPIQPETAGDGPLRVLFALPGFHRVSRGAEIAFENIARHLASDPKFDVTLIGSGEARADRPYHFRQAACRPRETFRRWPRLPMLRNECMYEELGFAWSLRHAYRPDEFDVTVGCSYPYTNWVLRGRRSGGRRPAYVYVTQNGHWPLISRSREYRYFSCDGLICTNPVYYEQHRSTWFSTLIGNGVEPDMFRPGASERARFGLPENGEVALIVSAFIASKRVVEGIRAASRVPGLFLAVAGDGELSHEVEETGAKLLPGRFKRLHLKPTEMPALYRSADVLLHMSQQEPFGNIYVEAMATGLPVVTHDWSATRWLVEGHGVLVDTNDEQNVAEAIRSALDRRTPTAATARREMVERRFSWAAIARQYGSFLRDVVQRRAQATATPTVRGGK